MSKQPPSVAELIQKHSKARVLHPSGKQFITGTDFLTGLPTMIRQLTDQDVKAQMIRQYS